MAVNPSVAAERRCCVVRIRTNPDFDQQGKRQSVWNYILAKEILDGTQFLRVVDTGALYAVVGHTNQILALPRRGGDEWHSYFQTMYSLGEREDDARWVYDALRSYAIEHGQRVELRRFASYRSATQTAYISSYDGRMWKISGSASHESVSCGEDGVFFADDDGGKHTPIDVGQHGILFDRLANPNFAPSGLSGITPEQQRKALIIWFLALGFPDLMPTKPLLMIEGVKGSGKSTLPMLMQLVLLGMKKPMMLKKSAEDDFAVILLRSPIALFDNTDSYIEWVPDAIASYCTGGVVDKRKLYTDDESIVLRPHAFIAVATRNPASFRRDDVAERCVILRLDRRTDFTATKLIEARLAADRPRLMGEYLWYVGRIIEELRASEAAGEEFGINETHRMADFAAFGRVVARVLGWEEGELSDVMSALQRERDAFINEGDPLVDLIETWLNYRIKIGTHAGRANSGRWVSETELHTELSSIALARDLKWIESPRSLAQKLRSSHIEQGFHVESKVENGHKMFRFRRASEAHLGVVP